MNCGIMTIRSPTCTKLFSFEGEDYRDSRNNYQKACDSDYEDEE